MKSVTEFPQFTLSQALKTKTSLLGEGKTVEEIEQSLGTSFKYEGDKLKHFMTALDVAEKYPDKLKRVLVLSLADGEAVPAKATQVEQTCYLPEFFIDAPTMKPVAKKDAKGGGRPRKSGSDSKKSSPWGITPEEKAAKAEKAKEAHREANKKA